MKLALFVLIAALSTVATAETVWYGGDIEDSGEYIINQQGGAISDARVYEDFVWNSSQPLGTATATLTSNFEPSSAYVEVRSGMAPGNAGTLVFGAVVPAMWSLVSGGTSTGPNIKVVASLPSISLTQGSTYWVCVAPIGTGADACQLGTTSGLNAVGSPGLNGNALFAFPDGGFNYVAASTMMNNPNFSMGVGAVPEPATSVIVAGGLLALLGRRRRAI